MIFYFSATGNTRWAVQLLAEATAETVVSIADYIDREHAAFDIEKEERIGFCFPVHGWQPPTIVRQFIDKLNIKAQGHYCYAICTAGDTIGETISIFEKDLEKKGIHLDAAFSLLMPESYVGLPFMDVDTPDNEKRKISQAAESLNRYMPDIINRKKGASPLHIGRWPKINSRIIGSVFVNVLITDKHFHVESEHCVKCGICAQSCPIGDIDGGLGQEPTWKHNGSCLTCFACYHHCPHHAIQYGKRTQKKGQYFFDRRKSGLSR